MTPTVAHGLRRAAFTASVLAASLVAHLVSAPGVHVLPIAPALWAGIVALAVLAGAPAVARGGAPAFREWGPGRILIAMLLGQMALHMALLPAPWALGLWGHHSGPAVTGGALAVHALAAVVLTALVRWGERVLARALRTVRALLGPVPRRALPRPGAVRVHVAPLRPVAARRAHPSRGPPAAASPATTVPLTA